MTTTQDLHVLHLLNLDTIGGVEELFVHFLEHAQKKTNQAMCIHHHVLITGERIHAHFSERIQKYAASISYEKYQFGIKIPKALRSLKRSFIFRQSFSSIVLWNRFDDLSRYAKNAQVIYYEHGASWMHEKTAHTPRFFERVDLIIANSNAAKEIITQKWNPQAPIVLIENPLRPDIHFASHAKELPQAPFCLGYIGRLIALKGVSLILHAIYALKKDGLQFSLKIAGHGQEKAKLEEETKKLGLENEVQFLGAIKDIAGFYDSIDLLIMPSIREPLGLVAIEAESRALPVIASHIDGLSEVVIHNKNGLSLDPTLMLSSYPKYGGTLKGMPDLVYYPKEKTLSNPRIIDPQVLADNIKSLLQNKREYERLSKGALEFAKSYPNFNDYVEKLLKTFSQKQRI